MITVAAAQTAVSMISSLFLLHSNDSGSNIHDGGARGNSHPLEVHAKAIRSASYSIKVLDAAELSIMASAFL